jgi:hypothetical protein
MSDGTCPWLPQECDPEKALDNAPESIRFLLFFRSDAPSARAWRCACYVYGQKPHEVSERLTGSMILFRSKTS